MDIHLERVGDTLVVELAGELDLLTAGVFREEIERVLERDGPRNIVLCMEEVSFIDSTGLGVILGRYKRVSQRQGKMVAVGVQPQVLRVLELSGVCKIIPVYETRQEALEAV